LKQFFLTLKTIFMGSIKKGILGGFSGKVGTVVGGRWKGIDYIRSMPVGNNSSSPAQQAQRAKFALVATFIRALGALVEFSFKDVGQYMTSMNSALSNALKNAVTGEYPDFQIDYSLVQVAKGSLPNATSPAAAAQAGGRIGFTWTNNSGTGQAKATDKAILVAYLPGRNECIFTQTADRSAGAAVLDVPSFAGREVHTWLAFITEKGEDVSPSVYTGKIAVS
jgi:hypothetical protein